MLRSRIAGHRSHMKSFGPIIEVTDENCMAAHLVMNHSVNDTKGFNTAYIIGEACFHTEHVINQGADVYKLPENLLTFWAQFG